MDHPFRWIDVFTDRPFSGNQLAVFTEGERLDESLLQKISREMNLAETVFLFSPREGGDARLRIFTTVEELPFAGHPVLGTACLMALEAGRAGTFQLRLETGRGHISVTVEIQDDGRVFGRMEQPLPTVRSWDGDSAGLLQLLGIERSVLPLELYDNGLKHLYVMARSVEEVAAIRPDFGRMAQLCGDARLSCFSGTGFRYVTRMFSPLDYVPEDPATGSAAGPLAAHLVRHGLVKSGTQIVISQGAQVGRPSVLLASAEGDGRALRRIVVGGSAVPMGGGALRFPSQSTSDGV